MRSLIDSLLKGAKPAAIGVSFGGPIDSDTGMVRLSNYSGDVYYFTTKWYYFGDVYSFSWLDWASVSETPRMNPGA
jgi:hypothetical protein